MSTKFLQNTFKSVAQGRGEPERLQFDTHDDNIIHPAETNDDVITPKHMDYLNRDLAYEDFFLGGNTERILQLHHSYQMARNDVEAIFQDAYLAAHNSRPDMVSRIDSIYASRADDQNGIGAMPQLREEWLVRNYIPQEIVAVRELGKLIMSDEKMLQAFVQTEQPEGQDSGKGMFRLTDAYTNLETMMAPARELLDLKAVLLQEREASLGSAPVGNPAGDTGWKPS